MQTDRQAAEQTDRHMDMVNALNTYNVPPLVCCSSIKARIIYNSQDSMCTCTTVQPDNGPIQTTPPDHTSPGPFCCWQYGGPRSRLAGRCTAGGRGGAGTITMATALTRAPSGSHLGVVTKQVSDNGQRSVRLRQDLVELPRTRTDV